MIRLREIWKKINNSLRAVLALLAGRLVKFFQQLMDSPTGLRTGWRGLLARPWTFGKFAGGRLSRVFRVGGDELADVTYKRAVIRLLVVGGVLLVISQAAVSWLTAEEFEQSALPEIRQKAYVTGGLAAEQIAVALSLGIPIDKLVGVEAFIDRILAEHDDFAYIALVGGADDEVFYGRTWEKTSMVGADIEEVTDVLNLRLPVIVGSKSVASLHIGLREGSVRTILAILRNDTVTIFIASLLVAIEFLFAFIVINLITPITFARRILEKGAEGDFTNRIRMGGITGGEFADSYNAIIRKINARYEQLQDEIQEARLLHYGRGARSRLDELMNTVRRRFKFSAEQSAKIQRPSSSMDIRIPFFLFIFSQELSRPFLPIYLSSIYEPFWGIGPAVAIGMPITAFMLVVLIVTPFSGWLTDRLPLRLIFAAGAIPSVVGHVGAAFAGSILTVLSWWMLAGVGYGMIFISAQIYVSRSATTTGRAMGMSVFAGAVYSAFICGPAIGGILVDQFGASQTLLIAGGLAVISGVMIFFLSEVPKVEGYSGRGAADLRSWKLLFSNRRFVALTLFSALPAKFMLAGLLFYLVPLYLNVLGSGQSEIGRVLMVYGIVCFLVMPIVAGYSDYFNKHEAFVVAGGIVAPIGCLLPLFGDSTLLITGTVVIMGIGHALLTAPQLTAIDSLSKSIGSESGIGTGTVFGTFRTVERVGTALGAVVVGIMVSLIGFTGAIVTTGLLMFACSLVYVVLTIRPRWLKAVV